MSRRHRSKLAMPQPLFRHATRISRAALAASVSVASLLALGTAPASAQQEGTLPGTQVLQGGRWTGAKLPTVAQGNEGLVMTIEQQQKRALLDWSRFDVASGEEVHFKQDGVDWIALNRIFDSKPSEIAGKITAKGQVWLQNTNGIIFKNGAKVNAHTIIATALPITEEQLNLGLLSGQGVIRGSGKDMLFADLYPGGTLALVPRPVDGLNPRGWLSPTTQPVGGENPTIIDLLARAAIRQAILRDRNYENVSGDAAQGYGLGLLNYYDPVTRKTVYYVDPKFAQNGLGEVLDSIVAGIDLSKMGDFDYADFIDNNLFFNGVSWQGKPATSGSIPQALRDEVAAQIQARFVDNYAAQVADAKQKYVNYVTNSRVTVEKGATLTALSSDASSPGKIMLFGPNVSNAGSLVAHDGQVLMAAGEQIKLSERAGLTNSQRGALAVNVMAVAVSDTAGSIPGEPYSSTGLNDWIATMIPRVQDIGMRALNTGTILADRGAVTMVGADVSQMGTILVTNGVRQRTGSIVLQASHGFNMSDASIGGNYLAGSLILGENSVTQITPDLSTLTGLAADSFAPGKILLAGKDILLDRGALVVSRSGEVTIHANPYGNGARGGTSPASPESTYMENRGDEGSFTMRSGAKIDVSGLLDVERSVADNVFAVEVRANEVSGAPKQRDGILVGQTVYVDRRDGTSLVDWTGALGGELRTAAQMSTKGGTVQIRASEFAIVEDGAVIDVSGGSTKFAGGEIKTTRLKDSYGRFHDIANADINLKYTGLYEATRVEEGYIEGADAGSVELLSGSARLFGKLKGDVVVGERQLMGAIGQIKTPKMPTGAVGAALVGTPGLPKAGSATLHRGGPEYSAWTSSHSFIMADEKAFTGVIHTEDAQGGSGFDATELLLDPSLIGQDWADYEGDQPKYVSFVEDDFFSGMGEITFGYGSSHQSQTINAGVSITTAAGGAFTMGAEAGVQTIGDAVKITSSSGLIQFSSGDGVTIGKDVLLSVAAQWYNDADMTNRAGIGHFDGGTINLLNAKLSGDVTLDAGGGGWYRRLTPPTRTGPGTFTLVNGKGGDIMLGGGGMTLAAILDRADINLAGLGGGGALGLSAGGNIVVGPQGGSTTTGEYISDTILNGIGAGSLLLGADSITFAAGANILFQQRNMVFDKAPLDIRSGSDLRDSTRLALLPDHQRTGASLSIQAGNVVVERGATIAVDPTGTLGINANNMTIDGTLRAHGGAITLSSNGAGNANILITGTALLDATGVSQTLKVPGGIDGRGFWYDGRILGGGTITIDASNLLVEAGALLDVSGTTGLLAVMRSGRYAAVKVNDVIGSNAGRISIDADGGYLLGTMRGKAGTDYNYAGTLNITGGFDGKLLLPGQTDWTTGQYGLESLLQALQWSINPPSPENPFSMRDLFRDNYAWAAEQLGFGPDDVEDLRFSSLDAFTAFLTAAYAPLVMQNPSDADGGLIFDPTLTAMPDLPPPPTGKFGVPEGYTPESAAALDRALSFFHQMVLYGPTLAEFGRGTKLTVGAPVMAAMSDFDTVSLSGNLQSQHAVDIKSKRVLNLNGLITGAADMNFAARNVNLSGLLMDGRSLAAPTSGTLTISGETVDFRSRLNVGGFEKVVIEASGDMRGGYIENNAVPTEQLTPGLYTTGDLVLRAAQIYPTTGGTLSFVSDQSIRIERTGRSEAPLSAGGLLKFTAPLIEQAGTLRAPFGEIQLNAVRVAQVDADGLPLYDEGGNALFTPGRIDLQAGSITSTSADGRTILYGSTYDGQSWYAPDRRPEDPELSTPPEKRVSLSGDVIDVRQGAVIDVSGGGDVLGLEFVAGPLGQTNVLDGPGVYAIVPAYGSSVIAPIDPLYNPGPGVGDNPATTGLSIGDAVWLAAFDGHAAGWYTLLPAEYALTPGGYRITLADGIAATQNTSVNGDDSFAVRGNIGVIGTTIADQVQSTFRVERGTDVRLRSEFFETYGNSFFSSERFLEGLKRSGNAFNADPRLPVDGGFLTLAANSSLTLDGTILAAGMAGVKDARGGIVDIASDNIVIAAPGTDVSDLAGYLVLDPNKISNIAESLLIGGIRRQGAAGLEIVTGQSTRDEGEVRSPEKSVGAEHVVIRTNAANALTGTELLFAANQSVLVESGSVVRATGDGADAANIAIAPSMPTFVHPWDPSQNAVAEDRGGAFLRVSNLGDITVSRTNVISDAGDMIVEAGAVLEATDSIILDATQNTLVGLDSTIKAGAITAASGLVSFGNAPAGADGLILSGGTLAGLSQASKLTLKSYSTFDFYGDVAFNLAGAAVFDGAAFVDRGTAPGSVTIGAGTIELRNTDAAAVDAIGNGGTLALKARNVVIGEGDIDFAYAATTVDAGERLIFSGLGDNRFDGSLTVHAAEISGASGAGHEVKAAGTLQLLANGSTAILPVLPTAGALLDFIGTSVDIGAAIRAGSGTVRATATEGDVRLISGAQIDVAGADVSFFEVQGFLPGGGVQLTSVNGDVLVDAGARVNISGGKAGGDAGTLVLSAGRGVAMLAGALEAKVATGYRGGGFGLTTSTLADFGGLNALLNASGFSRSRDFAILDGDVTLNGVTRVDALRIVTGSGDINVAADARIGSDSAKGGSILLASGGNLTVADGAAFDVNAKGADQRGGSVDLQVATGGSIDAGVASINVSGSGTGKGGEVRLRAPQVGGDVGVSRFAALVTGGDTQLEAFRVYDLADADGNAGNGHVAEIDSALQQSVIGDAAAFMNANADTIRGRLGQNGNGSFVIVPGIELRSEGDMDLVHSWNLAGARFGGRPGVLTLRAGGDLLINANLSDGFISAQPTPDVAHVPDGWEMGTDAPLPGVPVDDLTNDLSWSYNLVAGADFAQTNVLSTLTGSGGNIELGGLVRTGTGDVRVAAGGNLNYEQAQIIRYIGDFSAGTTITVPAGTVIPDGTVLKPSSYMAIDGDVRIINPGLAAGTIIRKGSKLPAGTLMPDGTTLTADTVLTADVTLTQETSFPGEVVLVGKTHMGSDYSLHIAANYQGGPSAPGVRTFSASVAGLGDVIISQPVGGSGDTSLQLADGRIIEPTSVSGFSFTPVEMLHGAIYTVGVEAAPVDNFTPPSHVGYTNSNGPGMVINPLYAENGGDISVNVGGSIVGAGTLIENFNWLIANGGTAETTRFGYNYPGKDPNAPFLDQIAQFQPDNRGQTSLSLAADRFRQGIGGLGGGDISIVSGGDVDNLLVALPTTVRVSGGRAQGDPKQVHYSGGGDLTMDVGGNLLGGVILVSKGEGTVDVAGSVMQTGQRASMLINPRNAAHLTLAIDDAKLTLQAGGGITLRGVVSTLGIADGRPRWLGYTDKSEVRITSLGGDITVAGVNSVNSGDMDIMPSKTALIATAGGINFGGRGDTVRTVIDMSADTRLDLLAQTNINFWGRGGSYQGADFMIGWADPAWVPRVENPVGYMGNLFGMPPSIDPLTGKPVFNQAGPGFGIDGANIHSGSLTYSRIYAAQGDLIGRGFENNPNLPQDAPHGGSFAFGHETRLKAGGNIRMGPITFITHDNADMSVMEAGGAIYLPNATLYGPGRLWVQAGDEIYMGRTAGEGIRALEAISSVPTAAPLSGGSISVLAGIDQAPEYDAFFDYYLNPETIDNAPTWLRQYYVMGDRGLSVSTDVVLKDGTTRATVYAIELINYMRELGGRAPIPTTVADAVSGSRDVTRGKLAASIDPAEYAAALAGFAELDPMLKQPLAVRILNAELKTAGREAVGASPETDGRLARNGDPTRGYDAIGRLFPGAQRKAGETLAEGEHRWTGDINMMVSQIRGESGGDVDLIAPGGSIQLASLSVADTNPGQAGIVTQRGGGINAIVHGDYIVNQSRTMTADDGDIMIWSSFGNIDAGRGRKSSLSVPPVAFPTDAWGQTRITLSGLPNGAGIATLDQVNGQQGGDVDLYAFNGIVNAGDAGIRASRDLFVGAIEVRGLDNITVGGLTNIDLTTDEGSVGPLNLENFAQSAEDKALDDAFSMSAEVEKLRTVRQTILTGSVVSFGTDDCAERGDQACNR